MYNIFFTLCISAVLFTFSDVSVDGTWPHKYLPEHHCGVHAKLDTSSHQNNVLRIHLPWTAVLVYETSNPPKSYSVYVGNSDEGLPKALPEITQNDPLYCTGVLITARHVITVAHCIHKKLKPKLHSVLLGTNYLEDYASEWQLDNRQQTRELRQQILVDRVIEHPGYTSSIQDNNIAILRLRNSAKINDIVQPICFPRAPLSSHSHQIMSIGRSNQDNEPYEPYPGRSKNHTLKSVWPPFAQKISPRQKIVAFVGLKRSQIVSRSSRVSPIFSDRVVIHDLNHCTEEFNVSLRQEQLCMKNPDEKKMCPFYLGAPIMRASGLDETRDQYFLMGLDATTRCGDFKHSVYTNAGHFMRWVFDNLDD